MAEHARAPSAGGGRQVARRPEQREKTEEGEHQSLLGFTVEKQGLERHHGSRGHAGREELDQAWIARAAARDHQLVGGPRGRPALNPSRDGLHGQRRRRRHSVVVGAPRPLHVVQEPRGVVRAEPFAPRALGRRRGEVGVREQGLEHLAGRLAAPCPLAAGVERRRRIDPTGYRVDHGDAGTSVEREGAAGHSAARCESDVRDAADVQQQPPALRVTEQHHVG